MDKGWNEKKQVAGEEGFTGNNSCSYMDEGQAKHDKEAAASGAAPTLFPARFTSARDGGVLAQHRAR